MEKLNKIQMIIYGCIIFLTGVYATNRLYGLTIGVDDFGYISNAGFMIGKQWKSLSEIMPYYSFGYSIILIPFVKFISNPITLFRTILVLNVLLLVASFYISIACVTKIHQRVSNSVIIFTCFIANMYTANFVYAKFVLTESMISLLFWIMTFLLLRIFDSCSNRKFALLGILCAFMFFVHQRTVVITAAVFITLIVMSFKKLINWKYIIITTTLFFITFILGNIYKEVLISGLYYNNQNVAINNFSGQLGKLFYLMSFNGMKDFIQGIFSKLYYFFIATLFIGGFGILAIIKHSIIATKNVKKQKITDYNYIYLFYLLSFFFSFLLQAFSLVVPVRYDLVIYGRYIEFLFGAIIIEGLLYIGFTKKSPFKWFMIWVILACCGVITTLSLFVKFDLPLITSYLSPTVYMFFSGRFSLQDGCFVSLQTVTILSVLVFILLRKNIKNENYNCYRLGCLICAGFWIIATIYIDNDIIKDHLLLKNEYFPIVESIKKSDLKVGFIIEPDKMDANRIRQMQYLIPNKEFERLSEEAIPSYEDKYLILIEKESAVYLNKLNESGWKIRCENYRYILYEM